MTDAPKPNPFLQTFYKTGHRPPITPRILRAIKFAITSKPSNAKDRADIKAAYDWACAMGVFFKAKRALRAEKKSAQTGEPSWLRARRNADPR